MKKRKDEGYRLSARCAVFAAAIIMPRAPAKFNMEEVNMEAT